MPMDFQDEGGGEDGFRGPWRSELEDEEGAQPVLPNRVWSCLLTQKDRYIDSTRPLRLQTSQGRFKSTLWIHEHAQCAFGRDCHAWL